MNNRIQIKTKSSSKVKDKKIHKVSLAKNDVMKYRIQAEKKRLSIESKYGSFDDEWDNWSPCEG